MTGAADPLGVFDAVVLAGGRSTRLGQDKARAMLDGARLVDRAVDAAITAGARRCVVVGPSSLRPGVPVVQEDPPFGGPVAGIAAGLTALSGESAAPGVLLLACDIAEPSTAVARLLTGLDDAVDGVHLLDPEGRAQWLVGIYRRTMLTSALAEIGEISGGAVRRLLAGRRLRGVTADAATSADIDTWEDLRDARARVEHGLASEEEHR